MGKTAVAIELSESERRELGGLASRRRAAAHDRAGLESSTQLMGRRTLMAAAGKWVAA
jgi:hypothetical protein